MLLTIGYLLLGGAAGAILQRSHFCTMGCVSDAVLFGSLRRLRVWALALAVALAGSQLLATSGLVDLTASHQPRGGWQAALALVGGVMFGVGMVHAGGCVSRNLVRLGGGSLKAGAALLAVVVAAVPTLALTTGPTAAHVYATAVPQRDLALGLALAAGLLAFCLRNPAFRRARADLATGLALGTLVPAGWLLTALAGARPASLNYLALDDPALLVPLVLGTIGGALTVAVRRGEFRREGFTAAGDRNRHLAGGLLMGAGGGLALGCTIGQGLTGVTTLSLGSFAALAGMLAGGWLGVKQLETGRLLPVPPRPSTGRRPHTKVADVAE